MSVEALRVNDGVEWVSSSGAPSIGSLSAVDVADTVLAAAARRRTAAVIIETGSRGHVLSVAGEGHTRCIAELPPLLADGVVARLALLADLDLTVPGEQLGRIRFGIDAGVTELIVAVRIQADGLGAEVRRIVGVDETASISPPPSVRAGRGTIGAYRLEGELGRGGAGIVYRAVHEALGRCVAIKVLHKDKAHRGEDAFRFVREARAASRIRHPAVVEVLDFGSLSDDRAFLVMELVDGQTLRQHLAQGALDPKRAVRIAEQVAEGLEAAHRAGVIHRDVKPENIFLVAGGKVKLGDFGAAKLKDLTPSDTDSGHFLATPCYMSPEVATAKPTDERSDLYSLGCVLFEMMVGKPPFLGASYYEVMAKHVNAPVPPLSSPHGQVPEILERIVQRSMAKRVEERYQAAREMAVDLRRATIILGRTGWRRWLPT